MFAKKSTSRIFSVLFVIVFMLAVTPLQSAHAAGVRYAKPAASGAGDCSSWANACILQTALTGAVSGDEIWVAAGTYKPTTGTDRTATFQLKSGVAVYGGFAGTETARDQRDPATNVTILSGDLKGDDVGFFNMLENVYHVVTGVTGATLDGITITAGYANSTAPNNSGGGMYNDSSSPTLTNVTFSRNSAKYGCCGAYFGGGGMYNTTGSSPTLTNVTFSDNTAEDGGGMFNNAGSNPTLTNVTFDGNMKTQDGGGMFNYSSNPTLTNVTFSGNSAFYGGGMFNNGGNTGSNPTLTNVTFSGNSAEDGGGGMYDFESNPTLMNVTFSGNSALVAYGGVGGGMYHYSSYSGNPTLTNVTFSGNSARDGGGMYNSSGNPTLTNVTFNGNTATRDGGGMVIHDIATLSNVTFSGNSADDGGGMYNNSTPSHTITTTLTNTTFANNTATNDGGGMYNSSSFPMLTNVTFSGNSASQKGGGMYNTLGNPTIRNTIFWSNTASSTGAQIFNDGSATVVRDSVVQAGCPAGSICANIIITDPRLGTLGNYGGSTLTIPLLPGSSAIDKGNDAICPATDQRGVARPQGAHCDVGAYEAFLGLFLPLIVK